MPALFHLLFYNLCVLKQGCVVYDDLNVVLVGLDDNRLGRLIWVEVLRSISKGGL